MNFPSYLLGEKRTQIRKRGYTYQEAALITMDHYSNCMKAASTSKARKRQHYYNTPLLDMRPSTNRATKLLVSRWKALSASGQWAVTKR